jgi:hypothetical protein
MIRCALVHDWLTGMRDGEKVLELLCKIFPDALVQAVQPSSAPSRPSSRRRSGITP